MDRFTKVLFLIGGATFLITLTLFFVASNVQSLSPRDNLHTCKSLVFNDNSATNIVFLSSETRAQSYIELFLKTEPFASNKEKFNIYLIDDADVTSECELYKGMAILCYSRKVLEVASSCSNDIVVVTSPESTEVRSSAYRNVISLNENHPSSVFLHEFGHVFGNFAEEYITNANPPSGSKNCQSSCNFEISDGCFEGCSLTDYFRSTESGLMRTLSARSYGSWNERTLTEKIEKSRNVLISGNAISEPVSCEDQEYYLVSAKQTDELQIISSESATGCVAGDLDAGYSYELKNADGQVEAQAYFKDSTIFTDVQSQDTLTGETYASEEIFYFSIPQTATGETLDVLNPEGAVIQSIPIDSLANTMCKI